MAGNAVSNGLDALVPTISYLLRASPRLSVIRVRRLPSGRLLHKLRIDKYDSIFSAGEVLAVESKVRVRTWDLRTGRPLSNKALQLGANRTLCTLSPDGQRMVIQDVGHLVIWNPRTGDTVAKYVARNVLTFASDSRRLLVEKFDGKLAVLNISTGKLVRTFDKLRDARLSSDGKYLLGSGDNGVEVRAVASGKQILKLRRALRAHFARPRR